MVTSMQSPKVESSSSIASMLGPSSSLLNTSMEPTPRGATSDLSLSTVWSEVPHAPSKAAACGHSAIDPGGLAAVDPAGLCFPLDLELGVDVVVGEGRPIGRGGTYIVWPGVFRGAEVAVKVFYTNTQEDKQGELLRWVGG